MTPTTSMTRYCGGKTRAGTKCRRERGWGTDHPGTGRCKLHGGSSPAGRKAAAHELIASLKPGMLGAEVSGEPIEASLENVRLASGLVAYHRLKLATLNGQTSRADEEAYEQALLARSRITESAIKSGVAERLVRIAERWSEQVALVCEDGLAALVEAGVKLTAANRTLYAQAVTRSLAKWEAEPIEGDATEQGQLKA